MIWQEGGKEYSLTSDVFQENELLGKNTMKAKDLEIDFRKTILSKSAQGMQTSYEDHRSG